jgi:Sec-independent protein translocase protein TatA
MVPTDALAFDCFGAVDFGPKELPERGQGIGESIRGFKSAMNSKSPEPKRISKRARQHKKTEVAR